MSEDQGRGRSRRSDILVSRGLSRRQLLRAVAATGGAVGAGWIVSACAPGTPTTSSPQPSASVGPKRGGTIVWGMTSDPVTLAPFGVGNTSSAEAKNLAYESLVRWDRNQKVEPALAESWETPDNKTYIFRLRKGVKFHSGKELDSDDVVYSLNGQQKPPPPGNVTSFYPKIASVEALDKYTVKLNMSQPDGTVLGYLAWNIYSYIVPKGLYERLDPRNAADGTGPFKITEFVPNDHVTYVRHADYWRTGFPYLDGLTLKVLSDAQARIAALRSGAMDGGTVPADAIPTLKGDANLKILKEVTAAFREIQMTIKGRGKPWESVKVRQAINSAIDRQEIIDKVYASDAKFTSKIPTSYGDWPIPETELRSKWQKYDLDAAKKLMSEAGQSSGFAVTLQAIANPNDYVQIAEVIKSQLAKININVTVQPLEIGTFATNNSTGNFEWASTGRGMRGDPSGYFTDFDPAGSTYKAWFEGGYKNEELTKLISDALGNPDQAKRKEQYRRMQEIVLTEWPTIPTVDPTIYQVVRSRVQNMYVSIDGTEKGLIETWVDQ